MIKCTDIGFGTYECAYNITLPYRVLDIYVEFPVERYKHVAIDKCLLPEILKLWEMGIKTTGCCCGHGKLPPFIGVKEEYIGKMKELGYTVQPNKCRPGDEDTFNAKTVIDRVDANCGFNWWDKLEEK